MEFKKKTQVYIFSAKIKYVFTDLTFFSDKQTKVQ